MLGHLRVFLGVGALLLTVHLRSFAQADPTVEWIRANAIPLTTTEAGNGFADMQRLKAIVGNARIVSLGEATHGTREFFQLKHRMLEFLATEMGFTIFSIEANMPEAYRLNDYVLNGTGDPAALLAGMYFWTWNTEEVLEMIKWMREFNASGRGRVQFTGFDMQTHTVALDIAQRFVSQYEAAYADTVREGGQQVARLTSPTNTSGGFGVATGSFPIEAARGKKIRYSGFIKTEGVSYGYAGLWWRVDSPSRQMLAFDNMAGRGPHGTADWKEFSIELPVDSSAGFIAFGMIMPGNGSAWFDDLKVEIDGKPYADSRFDFSFETGRGGFGGRRPDYLVGIDSTVSHGGRFSLRMQRVSGLNAPAPSAPVDSAAIVASWKNIVAHMEARRASYRAQGATNRYIDWAIQNARVVLQSAQMRARQVDRDESMANNVKWILDQNPGAKIALWAHNGHVASGRMMLARSMGEQLRTMYGTQMVVFGFGFNQGGFQAVHANTGLRNFQVAPAPAGSSDALFGAAGIPVFALDLRKSPASLREVRSSRQVGSMFMPDVEQNHILRFAAADVFDAILFVENTTAARPNQRR
jgi:erythromycin esterase-like protein